MKDECSVFSNWCCENVVYPDKNDIPVVAEKQRIKPENNVSWETIHMQKWPIVKEDYVKTEPRIYVLAEFDGQ